ncbi:MAG: hypothetical protein RLP09_25090 [Sandaracinaceae bacterium]
MSTCVLGVVLTAALAMACGSSGTHPDDMSAEAHREAAAGEEREAAEHQSHYDEDTGDGTGQHGVDPALYYGIDVYNPTREHRRKARQHRLLAEQHRSAAAALEAFEEQECARFPPETRAICPLLGQLASIEDVEGGVRLRFADGVRENAIAAHMRCHLAFGRTHGREGMDLCPLYVDGASVGSNDGITLTTSAGDDAVAELRRRSRAHAP